MTIEQIYSNYYDKLVSYNTYRLNGRVQDAKEVVQVSMIKIWKNLDKFDPEKANLSTFIFTINNRARIDFLRTKYRFSKTDLDDIVLLKKEFRCPCVNHDTMDLELNLNKINLIYRFVLYYKFIKEYTHEEISSEFNIPLGTVKGRVRIGLRELKKIYT